MNKDNKDKRTSILRAALELIAENGFHGSPTAMIASAAGVGTGTIYRYFNDKDVLINEVFKDIETRLNAALAVGYPSDQSVRQRLYHYYIGLIRFFIANPLEFKFLGQYYDSPYGVAVRRDKIFARSNNEYGNETIKSLFEQGIAQGAIKDLPIVILFGLFIGSLISVSRDHILGFIELDEQLLQRTADACWDAVKQ
ncbi:MAG: TetR/AcrR family transcriptional regulator [Desulfopila sp.]|jgi:AcrR family transcriptional regulator|nr:TetR/AcrR family transcriptional regulator [Desulfopila sp.]